MKSYHWPRDLFRPGQSGNVGEMFSQLDFGEHYRPVHKEPLRLIPLGRIDVPKHKSFKPFTQNPEWDQEYQQVIQKSKAGIYDKNNRKIRAQLRSDIISIISPILSSLSIPTDSESLSVFSDCIMEASHLKRNDSISDIPPEVLDFAITKIINLYRSFLIGAK